MRDTLATSSGEEADQSETTSPTPRHSLRTLGSSDSGVGGNNSDSDHNNEKENNTKGN